MNHMETRDLLRTSNALIDNRSTDKHTYINTPECQMAHEVFADSRYRVSAKLAKAEEEILHHRHHVRQTILVLMHDLQRAVKNLAIMQDQLSLSPTEYENHCLEVINESALVTMMSNPEYYQEFIDKIELHSSNIEEWFNKIYAVFNDHQDRDNIDFNEAFIKTSRSLTYRGTDDDDDDAVVDASEWFTDPNEKATHTDSVFTTGKKETSSLENNEDVKIIIKYIADSVDVEEEMYVDASFISEFPSSPAVPTHLECFLRKMIFKHDEYKDHPLRLLSEQEFYDEVKVTYVSLGTLKTKGE